MGAEQIKVYVELRLDDGEVKHEGLWAEPVGEALYKVWNLSAFVKGLNFMDLVRCGYVGVAHDVELPGEELFFSHVHLHGGPAPVRRFLPQLVHLIWNGEIDPGRVFDLILPLDQVAEGYRAMDERRAIKSLLWP
jgi:hypothetical protein